MICHFSVNLTNVVFLSWKRCFKALTVYLINLCGKCGLSVTGLGFLNDGFSRLDPCKAVVDVKTPLTPIHCWSISYSADPAFPTHQHQSDASKYSEWLNASLLGSHRATQVRERNQHTHKKTSDRSRSRRQEWLFSGSIRDISTLPTFTHGQKRR